MTRLLCIVCLFFGSYALAAQSFEVGEIQESYKGVIGEVIKAPISFKNTSSKAITLVVRKLNAMIGTNQRNYFCLDGHCLDQKIEDHTIRLDPGQSFNTLQIALEAGLVPGFSNVKYIAYNRTNPNDSMELDFTFVIEEKAARQNIYSSRHIMLQDLYPNPSNTVAFVEYKILNDRIKAKITLHNVLGNQVGEYDLPAYESKVKIRTEDLKPGIYFYTLHLDNKPVITQKLVVEGL